MCITGNPLFKEILFNPKLYFMRNSFLDYYKMILEKVSFDPDLFEKEFRKAIRSVEKHEADQLAEWVSSRKMRSDLVSIPTSNRRF